MVFISVSTISPESTTVLEKNKIFFQDFKHLRHIKEEELKNSQTPFENTLLPNHYLISKAFYPLLQIMLILGSLPIRIKAISGKIFYEYHSCSLLFLYSWVSMIWVAFFFGVFILNREFGIDWPFQLFLHNNDTRNVFKSVGDLSTPAWIIGVDRILRIMLPTFALINTFAVRLRVRPMVQFVNGWAPILHEFETVFGRYTFRIFSIQRASWFFLPIVGAAYVIAIIRINLSSQRFFLMDNWILTLWSKSAFVIFMVSAFVLSTIVTLLSLLTIKNVFHQVRKAISHQYQETNGRLTYHQVKAWIKLVTLVRDQVNFFIQFASLPELNDLMFTFITVLTMSYMAISLYLENLQTFAGEMMPIALGALAVASIRTYLKGQLADLIVNEEHAIGLDVIEMKIPNNGENCDDEAYKARFEMSILCNMIFTTPVQIRLGNIISLNKKLLLLIISQLASYLVVFLQFKRSPP